jgi:aminoglycoside phosphotransferase family enzyme
MIVLSSASTPLLELLSATQSSPHISANFSNGMSQYPNYQITDWHKSPSALLFLGRHEATGQQFVIKMLRPYQDTRYSLKTLSKRQQCLLEALRRNRVFTPELYIGLAPLYCLDLQQRTICIGEVMENPTRELLDAGTEYVLLMKPQDRDNRLDYLLARGEIASLMPLVEYVSDMHKRRVFRVSSKERLRWGSYDHLMQKLQHNLELLDFLVDRCNESDWGDRKELAERVIKVKKKAQEIALQGCYHQYFRLRIAQGHIKLCHGDIKSPHIWIASDGSYGEEALSFNILDAIDFNHMYNYIDILSDFAMLIADVQARTQFPTIIDEMIDSYLRKTDQDNEVARGVLDYYVIEKAIVGTGISILYDDEPQLGRSFLKVAEHRLESMRAVGAVV